MDLQTKQTLTNDPFSAGLALTGAVSALALAAMAVATATPAKAATWTGCHLGAFGGMSAVKHELSSHASASYEGETYYTESSTLDGLGGDGVQIGFTAGCDYQQGRMVIGGFADYAVQELETTISSSYSYDDETYSESATLSVDNQWSIGARAGVTVNPSTLAYALVAYTGAETSSSANLGVELPELSGWSVGGGIETLLTPNVSINAQYRYTKFDTETLDSWAESDGDWRASGREELDVSQHAVRVALNYRFGGDGSPMADQRFVEESKPVCQKGERGCPLK